MDSFSIGEIAIYKPNLLPGQYLNGPGREGEDCEVISKIFSGKYGPSHYVSFNGDPGPLGRGWIVEVADLRKRPENARKWFNENIKVKEDVPEIFEGTREALNNLTWR